MANKVLLITGVIIFGVVATIIVINYYFPPPNASTGIVSLVLE